MVQGTFTINLAKPMRSVEILDNYKVSVPCAASDNGTRNSDTTSLSSHSEVDLAAETQELTLMTDLENQKAEVVQLCQTLKCLVDKLNQSFSDILARHKEEIAKLSVEIARRILMQKVQAGDYKIESIVKEVLENAPTRQAVVVHLNPDDLAQYEKLQQDDPGSTLADIQFVADPNIGRAECLLETPKGIIKWFNNEHMERISQALEKVE